MRDGGPAFPNWVVNVDGGYVGMTLRDYFAAAALQGWLSSYPSEIAREDVAKDVGGLASFIYNIADTMLTEREKEKP